MIDLEKLYARLERHEGVKPIVYDDATGKRIVPGSVVVGHPTIGVGHACDINPLSPGVMRAILAEDVAGVIAGCRVAFEWFDGLDDVRREVIVNMCFNMGLFGVAGFVNMVRAIKAKDYMQAALEMRKSQWAEQVGDRAKELICAMEDGCWPRLLA